MITGVTNYDYVNESGTFLIEIIDPEGYQISRLDDDLTYTTTPASIEIASITPESNVVQAITSYTFQLVVN